MKNNWLKLLGSTCFYWAAGPFAMAVGPGVGPPAKPVRTVTIYATLPIAKYIRYPIDSVGIKAHYEAIVAVKRPTHYVARLAQALAQEKADTSKRFGFGYGQVRVLCAITYQDSTTQSIMLDAGRFLRYNHQLYRASPQLLKVLLPKKLRKEAGI